MHRSWVIVSIIGHRCKGGLKSSSFTFPSIVYIGLSQIILSAQIETQRFAITKENYSSAQDKLEQHEDFQVRLLLLDDVRCYLFSERDF